MLHCTISGIQLISWKASESLIRGGELSRRSFDAWMNPWMDGSHCQPKGVDPKAYTNKIVGFNLDDQCTDWPFTGPICCMAADRKYACVVWILIDSRYIII